MRPLSSIKKWVPVLLALCMISGCMPSKRHDDTITIGAWLHEVCRQSGIISHASEKPYFKDIKKSNTYFDDVQAAVEWKLISPEDTFSLEDGLDRQWTAYTLMNLSGEKTDSKVEIKDISDTKFPAQVQASAATVLMHVDHNNRFYPKKKINKKEAEDLLHKVVNKINNQKITDTHTDIDWKEGLKVSEIQPLSFNAGTNEAVLPQGVQAVRGEILHWQDESGTDLWKEVSDVSDDTVALKDIDILSKAETMDLSGSADLNFNDAEIIDGNGNVIQKGNIQPHIVTTSARPLTRSFDIHGFNVSLTSSASSVNCEVSRTMPTGSKLYGNVRAAGVHVDYSWKSEETDVKNAYFKVNFTSSEEIGLKNSDYKHVYADFEDVKPQEFLSRITSVWKAKNDVIDDTLTLAEIRLPVPGAPMVNVSLKLDLTIGIDGRAVITLKQVNCVGCEVRNGAMRVIKDTTNEQNTSFRANAKALVGMRLGLDLTKFTLADVGVEAGAKASMKTTVHLYDEEGGHSTQTTDVPADAVDAAADGNQNVLVCSDLQAYGIINIKLNSSSTALGKVGLSGTYSILNDKNASLIPGGKGHLENFQFVDKCTRKNRQKKTSSDQLSVTNQITLEKYSVAVHAGSGYQIQVISLPSGYTKNQLRYASSDPSVASVDENGYITAHKSGGAVITIETDDHVKKISCSIIVPQAG